MGAIIIDNGMDRLAGWDGALDRIEETDELLVTMALQAATEDGAVEHACTNVAINENAEP